MDAGSRQEDASNQEGRGPFRFIETEKAAGRYVQQLYLRVMLSIASSRAGAVMQLLQILSLFFSLASSA